MAILSKRTIYQKDLAIMPERLPGNFVLLLVFLLLSPFASAQETICAQVKIEIKQELTLERQAFDANMVITNGLTGVNIENVDIDVLFEDEEGISVLASSDPNNSSASFFIRVDSMDGINDVDGGGVVEGNSTADIHWLIIPAPGSGGVVPSGKLYYVGARLSYTIEGEETTMEVSPDFIYVKPLPELTLDYFLPRDVFADDAFTQEVEPSIPFTLGVRINNTGDGAGQSIKIESAQPEIVENEQGLLIDFKIISSNVQGEPQAPSLQIDFGEIPSGSAKMGRWQMTTTLSGKFVAFDAEFTHSDELGGQLTSVIDQVVTHTLVQDVLVDLPGRDSVRDFLAADGVMRVYESNGTDTVVSDISAVAILGPAAFSGAVARHTITTPQAAGFTYLKVPDPHAGTKEVTRVIRSDGKVLPAANAWASKERKANPQAGWDYYLNVFDVSSTGSYSVIMDAPVIPQLPPVMQFIPNRVVGELSQVSFLVEASDPNGTVPSLSSSSLPNGAIFADQGNGIGVFDWTPGLGTSGNYPIIFTASDGALSTSQYSQITVQGSVDADTDGDGLPDQWELDNFGDLSRDGSGDYDADGISDYQEYLNGSDPLGLDGPSTPVIAFPASNETLLSTPFSLTVENSSHPNPEEDITYDFEIYSDHKLSQLLASQHSVIEQLGTTSWLVSGAAVLDSLPEDTQLVWRVRAYDGVLASPWVYGSFTINTVDDPTIAPVLTYPGIGNEVDTLQPQFEVINGFAPDKPYNANLQYVFEISENDAFTSLIESSEAVLASETGVTRWQPENELVDGATYHWRVRFTEYDNSGQTSEQVTSPVAFTVDTTNSRPALPVVIAPSTGAEIGVGGTYYLRVGSELVDQDGDTTLYVFELDTVRTFDSPSLMTSPAITPSNPDSVTWELSGLEDNTRYYWRVQALDADGATPWVYSSFMINSQNDPPLEPPVCNPGSKAWLQSLRPVLKVSDLPDLDQDAKTYEFELVEVITGDLVGEYQGDQAFWRMADGQLSDHHWYEWRARAVDDSGLAGDWSANRTFYINTYNELVYIPSIELLSPSVDMRNPESDVVISWIDRDDDSNANISLFYDTNNVGQDGTLIAADLSEDEDGSDGYFSWDTSGLPFGSYFVYGVISDGSDSAHSYAPAKITIEEQSDGSGGTGNDTGIIGDFAWHDLDADGWQDAGEPGLGGVTVTLWLNCDSSNTLTTATDSGGSYSFENLAAGNYQLAFDLPAGFEFSPANATGTENNDSNPDPLTGLTGCLTLAAGQVLDSVDAGFVEPGGGSTSEELQLVQLVFNRNAESLWLRASSDAVPEGSSEITATAVFDGQEVVLGILGWKADKGFYQQNFMNITCRPDSIILTSASGTQITEPVVGYGGDETCSDTETLELSNAIYFDASNKLWVRATSDALPEGSSNITAIAVLQGHEVVLGNVGWKANKGAYQQNFSGISCKPDSLILISDSGAQTTGPVSGGGGSQNCGSTETLEITNAIYFTSTNRLWIKASSDATPDGSSMISATVVSNGVESNLGTVGWKSNRSAYQQVFRNINQIPQSVVIKSDSGATATSSVRIRN
ncbi:SdrD B-like domain-containing protein [Halioxenophilus aromaticivorans]|uniref:SD-repeat containing protein B domain-containing protein n=1 Tax=Halioxenophilus aromaticivorans TaxID=1306992 RepID=A0AAV3U062_9ALTE